MGLPGKALISSISVTQEPKQLKPEVTQQVRSEAGPESGLLTPKPALFLSSPFKNF